MHVTANGDKGHKGIMKAIMDRIMRGRGDLYEVREQDWIGPSKAVVFKLSYEG